MKLFNDWELLTANINSPKPWIDASFYFMLGAALQRRVWIGGLDAHPVFPNVYMSFIGPAGVGKSLVVSTMKDVINIKKAPLAEGTDEQFDAVVEGNKKNHQGGGQPLVYLAPNSTTFEQLVQETAKIAYIHRYKDERGVAKVYHHSSLTFVLDEITSIFKKNTEDMSNYLLEAYNAGRSYTRVLKHNGSDYCTNICVSILGNTTDEKFRSMQNKDILTDGFISRTIIVWGTEKRFGMFMIPDLTPQQREARDRLQAHVRKMHTLYGPMTFAPGVLEYCNELFVNNYKKLVHNNHPLLVGYYERKNLHAMKIMMAVHFGRTTDDMIITQEDVDKTLSLLEGWEKTMHVPFIGMGRNETMKVAEAIANVVEGSQNGLPKTALFARFHSQCKNFQEFEQIIKDLTLLGRIREQVKGPVIYYVKQ
jgi:hypothetical protein